MLKYASNYNSLYCMLSRYNGTGPHQKHEIQSNTHHRYKEKKKPDEHVQGRAKNQGSPFLGACISMAASYKPSYMDLTHVHGYRHAGQQIHTHSNACSPAPKYSGPCM